LSLVRSSTGAPAVPSLPSPTPNLSL
jgi:hypothetical protein